MFELILTSLVILLFLLGFIYLLGTFKIINILLYLGQLIFAIIFVAITPYKNHILMNDLVTHVHEKEFNAITWIELKGNNNDKYLNLFFEKNTNYSSIYDLEYSNECLENYFISDTECPITNIIIENEKKK